MICDSLYALLYIQLRFIAMVDQASDSVTTLT